MHEAAKELPGCCPPPLGTSRPGGRQRDGLLEDAVGALTSVITAGGRFPRCGFNLRLRDPPAGEVSPQMP